MSTTYLTVEEAEAVEYAKDILAGKLRATGQALTAPAIVKDLCTLELAHHTREHFAVLYLDAQNSLIEMRIEAVGTLTACAIYPREIAKAALELNAAAVIFSHNHPSGLAEPSRADEQLTDTLANALKALDIKVLDHIIVAKTKTYSFAEHGLI